MAERIAISPQNSPRVINLSDSEPEDFDVANPTQSSFENITSKKRTRKGKTGNSPSKKAKTENTHECSICLSKIKTKRMGNPSGCKHNFCVVCIKKWAKKNSTCPLDRQTFTWINILDVVSGNLVAKIDKDGKTLEKIHTDPACFMCCSSENPKLMITCDGCDDKFHVGCLQNPDSVTVSLWFCTTCEGFPQRELNKNICKFNSEARSLALQRYKIHLRALTMDKSRVSNRKPVVKPEAEAEVVELRPSATRTDASGPQDILLQIMRSQESLFQVRARKQSSIPKTSTPPSNADGSSRLAIVERMAKNILKPYFMNKSVNKEKAKQILKIVVPKICKETDSSTDHQVLNQMVQEKVLVCLLLEDSISELQISIEELLKRVDQAEDESNEWRTRFENQLELNEYLQLQSQNLAQKIEEAREAIKEIRASRSSKTFEKIGPDSLKGMERKVLQKQLKNMEMRLDQESKAYHRSNEEKKNLTLELNIAKNSSELLKKPIFSTNLSTDFRGSQHKRLGGSKV